MLAYYEGSWLDIYHLEFRSSYQEYIYDICTFQII